MLVVVMVLRVKMELCVGRGVERMAEFGSAVFVVHKERRLGKNV